MSDFTTSDDNVNTDYPTDPTISVGDGRGNVSVRDGGAKDGLAFTKVQLESEMSDKDWFASQGMQFVKDVRPHVEDDYLVDGVLSIGALSVLYGPSNSGKTFLAMDLAYRIARGYRWHGHKVKKAAVLYYATEGGNGSRNRITALNDVHEDEVNSFVPFVLRSGPLDLLSDDVDLEMMKKQVARLKQATGIDTVLVVIDTLSRTMACGDENGSQHMTTVVQRVDRLRHETGAHVQLVHHTGKDVARGARGHSSLRAAVDTEIEVTESNGERKAVITKQRDYETGKSYGFTLEEYEIAKRKSDGEPVTTCYAKQAGAKPGWTLEHRNAIVASIEAAALAGEPLSSEKNAKTRWVIPVIKKIAGIVEDGKADSKAKDMLDSLIRNGDVSEQKFKNKDNRDRSGLFVVQKSE